MNSRYPHVSSSARIGPVEIKNRLYFAPNANPLSVSNLPSTDFVSYYEERAANGVGLLLQALPVLPQQGPRQCAFKESSIPAFQAVAEAIHQHGSKIFGQLAHNSGQLAEWGPLRPSKPALGPSAYKMSGRHFTTHEMSREHIRLFVEAYATNARHLRQAGYDGVEVYCTHGGLIENFLSPFWNKRTDEYGGNVENRMRYFVEVIEAVREACGPEMAVGVRMISDELLPGALSSSDIGELVERLAALGILDFFDFDAGEHLELEIPAYILGERLHEKSVSEVRPSAGDIPVLSTLSRITTVEMAEQALADGVVDMLGVARALIADPEFLKNALEGREEHTRICIGGNYCLAAYTSLGRVGCQINPASGRERIWGLKSFEAAADPKKVVVVGGGVAGLEAARVAAKLGHQVLLFEKNQDVGGQMTLWAALPGREIFATTALWYEAELEDLGVEVRTGMEATASDVMACEPDAVVVATGSRYAEDGENGWRQRPVPGWDQDFVFSPEDILEGGERPKGKVVVLDDEGINTALGIAEILAIDGADVEYVGSTENLAPTLQATGELGTIQRRLAEHGAIIHQHSFIKSIGRHEVTIQDIVTDAQRVIRIDAVVLATMRRPQAALAEELDGKVDQLYLIGDAAAPRGLAEATYEGQKFARLIGQDGAPHNFAQAYFGMIEPHEAAAPAG